MNRKYAVMVAAIMFALGCAFTLVDVSKAWATMISTCARSSVQVSEPITVNTDHAQVSFNAPTGCHTGLASYESPSAKFDAQNVSQQSLYSSVDGIGNGEVQMLEIHIPPCGPYQIDFFVGNVIEHLSATNLYNGSLVGSVSGGSASCETTTTTSTTVAPSGTQTQNVVKPPTANTSGTGSAPIAQHVSTPTTELASKQLARTGSSHLGRDISIGIMLIALGLLSVYAGSMRAARRFGFDYRNDESVDRH